MKALLLIFFIFFSTNSYSANKLANEFAYTLATIELAPKACQFTLNQSIRASLLHKSLLNEKTIKDDLNMDYDDFYPIYTEALHKAKIKIEENNAKKYLLNICPQVLNASSIAPESYTGPAASILELTGFYISSLRNCRILYNQSTQIEEFINNIIHNPVFDKSDLTESQIMEAADNFSKSYDTLFFNKIGKHMFCPSSSYAFNTLNKLPISHPVAFTIALNFKMSEACPNLSSNEKRLIRINANLEIEKNEFYEKFRIKDNILAFLVRNLSELASSAIRENNTQLCRSAGILATDLANINRLLK